MALPQTRGCWNRQRIVRPCTVGTTKAMTMIWQICAMRQGSSLEGNSCKVGGIRHFAAFQLPIELISRSHEQQCHASFVLAMKRNLINLNALIECAA